MLFDYENASGLVFESMKYRKRIISKQTQELAEASSANSTISNAEIEDSDKAIEQLGQCLSGFILPRDMKKLKEYLKKTVQLRVLVTINGYPKMFLFYLTNPELVSTLFLFGGFFEIFSC